MTGGRLPFFKADRKSELLRTTILIFQLPSLATNQGTACRDPVGTISWQMVFSSPLAWQPVARESEKTAV